MMAGKVEVDEATLRALYDERVDQYVQPERRLVERLVFGTEDEAAGGGGRASTRARRPSTTLVEERGLTLEDVDLGDVARDDLGAARRDAVFALDGAGRRRAGRRPTSARRCSA